jgi:hypothetical protein
MMWGAGHANTRIFLTRVNTSVISFAQVAFSTFASVLAVFLPASLIQAGFTLIEDFEDYPAGDPQLLQSTVLDSVPNLIKYALGLSPRQPAASQNLPVNSFDETRELTLTYHQRPVDFGQMWAGRPF